MVNPLWLRTFVTLVEQKHFTRAAALLHMTQPGVSQHIRKLETYYQSPLINRFEKHFELTLEGEKLLQFARDFLSQEQQFKETLGEDSPFEGICRLSSPGALAMRLYPQLCDIQKQHPALIIHFEVAPNHRIISELINNTVDIGLITHQVDTPELITTAMEQESLCLVVPSAIKKVAFDELCHLGVIIHPDAHHHIPAVLKANFPEFQHLSEFQVKGAINQINLILEPVAAGHGFTVIPESMVRAFHNKAGIHIVPLSIPVYETIYLAHKRHRAPASRYDYILSQLFPQQFSSLNS
ncbi:LysR family transcriptional regulator [uncultured Endozoicomonas sp.]|uniref:LysR family transcriptional regulator n=1 Tax=uncultured Endozoicomonas sp. TaxID=432652 RepID=UPI002632BA20|nr:LysR family transcriptional regulator [uncultured Endozoicomonas sp.]